MRKEGKKKGKIPQRGGEGSPLASRPRGGKNLPKGRGKKKGGVRCRWGGEGKESELLVSAKKRL